MGCFGSDPGWALFWCFMVINGSRVHGWRLRGAVNIWAWVCIYMPDGIAVFLQRVTRYPLSQFKDGSVHLVDIVEKHSA